MSWKSYNLTLKDHRGGCMGKTIGNFVIFIQEAFREDKKYFVYFLLTIFLKALSPFALVIFPRYILNEIVGAHRLNFIVTYILAMGAINIVVDIFTNICEPKLSRQIHHLRTKLSEGLSRHILQMDYEYMENAKIMDLKEKAVQFVYGGAGIDSFTFTSEILIVNMMQIIGYAYLLININPFIIIAIIAVSFLNASLQGRCERYSYEAEMEVMRPNRRGSYIDYVCSDFSHVKDIKLFNIQSWILAKRKQFNDIKLRSFDQVSSRFVSLGVNSSLINNILNIGIYFYLIFMLVMKKILIGDFTMYLSVVTNFSASVGGVFTSFVKFQQVSRYLDNYILFKNTENRVNVAKPIKDLTDSFFAISFINVSFKYPGQDEYALRNITATIRGNQRVSIVGQNGAGKTTFIKLLMRLYDPTEGEIVINGINIKDIDYEAYLKNFSAVFQDFKLLAFPIKENVAFDRSEDYSDEDCIRLLTDVGLKKKIADLPKGVHTCIGKQFDEEGTDLSGGESQKIAIAKALFRDSPIVVLDEPTAALDPISEYEIYKSFDGLVKNKTSIFISHRLSSTMFSDIIFVFDQGQIVEIGSHDQLIESDGLYREMFQKQAHFYIRQNKDVRK